MLVEVKTLKEYLAIKGITLDELSKKSGINIRTVFRIVNKVNRATFDNAIKIAKALEITLDEFVRLYQCIDV